MITCPRCTVLEAAIVRAKSLALAAAAQSNDPLLSAIDVLGCALERQPPESRPSEQTSGLPPPSPVEQTESVAGIPPAGDALGSVCDACGHDEADHGEEPARCFAKVGHGPAKYCSCTSYREPFTDEDRLRGWLNASDSVRRVSESDWQSLLAVLAGVRADATRRTSVSVGEEPDGTEKPGGMFSFADITKRAEDAKRALSAQRSSEGTVVARSAARCKCGSHEVPSHIDGVNWYWSRHTREACTLDLPNERCWCGRLRSEHQDEHGHAPAQRSNDASVGGLCTWCKKPMTGHPMMSCVGEIEPGSVADEVLTLVHAFGDVGRKDAVRALAHRVRRLEERAGRATALGLT